MDIDGIAMGGFVRQLRKGNMTAFTLHAKTQWGWSERKGRPVPFALPDVTDAKGVITAMAAVVAAVAGGILSSEEAQLLAGVLEIQRRAIETVENEARIAALEQKAQAHEPQETHRSA
jgi:hypothetical protein